MDQPVQAINYSSHQYSQARERCGLPLPPEVLCCSNINNYSRLWSNATPVLIVSDLTSATALADHMALALGLLLHAVQLRGSPSSHLRRSLCLHVCSLDTSYLASRCPVEV